MAFRENVIHVMLKEKFQKLTVGQGRILGPRISIGSET